VDLHLHRVHFLVIIIIITSHRSALTQPTVAKRRQRNDTTRAVEVGLKKHRLHCALAKLPQCIVIGPVCGFVCVCVCVCLWVCYHHNSKLRASILTKLGLYVKVVTISS